MGISPPNQLLKIFMSKTVSIQYLKVEGRLKLLISQSKFSGSFRLQKHSPMNENHKEIVPARSPLASLEMHTPAHAPITLSTVEEEEKEKQSSASADSSSCDGQPLDTDAVKDALIRFQSQSSLDQTKHRQYSIDVVEVSADDVIEDIPGKSYAE